MANRLRAFALILSLLLPSCLVACGTAYTDPEESDVTSDPSSESSVFIEDASSSVESEINDTSDNSSVSDTSDSSDTSDNSDISDNTDTSDNSVAPEDVTPLPDDAELVDISDYVDGVAIDLRYATENNFTGQVIYESNTALLRYGTVKKLIEVQKELNRLGYGLLIWDGYRPTEAQQKLWDICPDPNFVSDPGKGYSGHCRGNTVDVTLIRLDGNEVEMPSAFDEFSALADRDYSDVSETAAENARLLESVMLKHGFTGYSKEWWHYSDTVKYDVIE